MRANWRSIVFGGLAVVALIAAACGPAAAPSEEGATPAGTGGGGGLDLTPISIGSGSGQTTAPGSGTSSQGQAQASVSGIPLDPNAKTGGVLTTIATTEGPTFSNWEEAAGIPPYVNHKLLNMIVRPRTWGTEEDYRNNAFFELHPDLAESWEQSPDGLQWVFKLRDGVAWSDGTPLTCADTKWSLDTIRTGEGLNRSPRGVHFLAVDTIECPDDLTMVINMKRPKPAFLEVVGMPYHVVMPKHVYENNTDLMREQPAQATTGPFILNEWIPGEHYIFERNPDYWDKPFPYLDGVEITILARAAHVAALRTSRIDVGDPHGYSAARGDTLIAECDVCAIWPRSIGSSLTAVMLNHQRPPWNTPEVMDAFSLGLDRNKYISVATQGWAAPPTGCAFYPTGPWAMPTDRCKQVPGYNFDDPEGNKEKARQLLADAGYQPGELSVTVFFWSSVAEGGGVPPIIEDMQAIGVNATAEALETARAYATWTDGSFDIGVHGFWVAGLDPDVTLYEQFYTGSDRNYNRYNNPEFDRLVDEMSSTVDPELRKQRAWDAMEMALNDQAKIILSHSTYVPVFNKRVQGLMPALNYLAGYGPQNRYDHTWLSQ
jgi:peptide/nickel transport system substrate-binding protein